MFYSGLLARLAEAAGATPANVRNAAKKIKDMNITTRQNRVCFEAGRFFNAWNTSLCPKNGVPATAVSSLTVCKTLYFNSSHPP
jgi:hypothetical protein